MAAEVAVDMLAAKLETLLSEKELSAGSRRKVSTFLKMLESRRGILKGGDEKARKNQQPDPSSKTNHVVETDEEFAKVLQYIYNLDEKVDMITPEISPRMKVNFPQFLFACNQSTLSREREQNPQENDDSGNNSHPSQSTIPEVTDRWERIAARAEDSANIVGLEDQKEDLRKLILENRCSSPIIAVIGQAGSGKTTLVKYLFDSIEVKKKFECCAWITVSDKFDKRDLLIDLMRQISFVKEEQKLELKELQERVFNYLKPRTFLLVFDDIQSDDVWNELKAAIPSTVHTSRVILTMRSIDVARSLESRIQLFEIRSLNAKETWDLFEKTIASKKEKLDGKSKEELETEIVKKCDGLPLAVVTLGGLLLFAKPVDQWLGWVQQKIDTKLSKQGDILFLSYQELPSSLKPFLLYFGIFPKSHKIPIRRLFRLWLAEGLVTQKAAGGLGREAEDLLEENFENLVKRNLIVVAKRRFGSPKTCMAQPALHDSLFPAASSTGFFHVQLNDQGQSGLKVVRRLVHHSGTPKNDLDLKHMRSYISFNSQKGDTPATEVDELLKHITNARSFVLLIVLDLENVYKPVLSETLGKLVRLKYLGLRWTFLDSIPESIGKLICLETLDVKHTNIPSLPNSIWKAKQLRHLYMNEIHFHISKKMGNINLLLSELQTLWGLLVGKDYLAMLIWLKQLSNLRKLGLTCLDSSVIKITKWISGLEHLQSLRLRSINKYNEPSNLILPNLKEQTKLHELHLFGILKNSFEGLAHLKNLRILTLSVSQREEDPMSVLGTLAHLNILRLFARSYIGTKMKCNRDRFTKLRVLKLWVLEKLEEWIVEEGSMVELRELEIRCCERLEWPASLQYLTNSLKELNLSNMPEKFVEDARANMGENVLLVINPKKLDIPPLPSPDRG